MFPLSAFLWVPGFLAGSGSSVLCCSGVCFPPFFWLFLFWSACHLCVGSVPKTGEALSRIPSLSGRIHSSSYSALGFLEELEIRCGRSKPYMLAHVSAEEPSSAIETSLFSALGGMFREVSTHSRSCVLERK